MSGIKLVGIPEADDIVNHVKVMGRLLMIRIDIQYYVKNIT